MVSPSVASSTRSRPAVFCRSSTSQVAPSCEDSVRGVEKWTVTSCPSAWPQPRLPSTAAAIVPEVLTTSRSPARRYRPRSAKVAWASPSGVAASSRTPSLESPRCSGGLLAGDLIGAPPGGIVSSAARYRPLGGRSSSSLQQGGNDGVRLGPVRDVLAGEGLLVHLRPHVARVERVAPQPRLLLAQHGGELVKPGLRRAVAAPAGIGLDGGVRADVDDGAAGGGERLDDGLDQRQRRDHVGLVDLTQLIDPIVGQLRQRAGAERAGVVDQQVQPSAGLADQRR